MIHVKTLNFSSEKLRVELQINVCFTSIQFNSIQHFTLVTTTTSICNHCCRCRRCRRWAAAAQRGDIPPTRKGPPPPPRPPPPPPRPPPPHAHILPSPAASPPRCFRPSSPCAVERCRLTASCRAAGLVDCCHFLLLLLLLLLAMLLLLLIPAAAREDGREGRRHRPPSRL
jgi:hypothetical protein